VLTSNRTRELAEALRRRCVYHWIGYPDAEREARIIMLRAGDVAEATAQAVSRAVLEVRQRPLAKPPGIAEAIEWANAATILEKGGSPWPEAFRRAIGVLIKDEEDLSYIAPDLPALVERALA
jgi:MoxR-like ATPase